ncbi:MAG: hypothetical protein EXS18_00440 [Verrucomicrobiae bacterium]|nr:hypothetical protein [Verrucomicrobiae bacterium]
MSNLPVDNPARERAIRELDTTFLVEASAGTGKTTLAINRILNTVRTGKATMDQIVAITFTEKAAGELKMRLRESMEKARREASGEERNRLTEGIRQLERSHVNTIHGFCSWLLKERPIEARVDPSFQVLDALGTELLQEETWTEWIDGQMEKRPEVLKRALFAEVSLKKLRSIAFDLVDKRDRTNLGELKPSEYTVADGVAELKSILAKLKPRLVNCIDHTDGAYEQIAALIDLSARMDGWKDYRREYELIHSVHVKKNAGAQKNWDDKDSLKTIKAGYETLNAIPARRCDALLRDLAAWLKEFVTAFERAKAVRGVLDFDDLLIKTRELLAGNLAVRAEFQRRFAVLLVDEFQDTDPVQAEIVFFLAEQEPKANRWDEVKLQPGKLFLVGDPKQSIYRFRRADIEIYEAAKRTVERQGEVLHITQSFRTASSLLAWINFTFDQLIQPPDDGGKYQPKYVPLHESAGHHAKTPRLCLLEPTADQRALIEGARIEVARGFEAREVTRLIEHAVKSGEWKIQGREDKEPRTPRLSDFAVLLHSPQTSLASYETALQQQGIPYQVDGGKDYFQSQEIRAVCALLLALDDPMNTRELVGVLRSAVFGFSDEEIYLWVREKPLDYQGSEFRVQGSVGDALALLRNLHEQRNEHTFAGYLELIYRELKLPELFSLKPHGHQRVSNLMKLIAVARRVQGAGLLSLREFVNYIRTTALARSEEGQSPSAEANDDVIKVLSIHKAKGLEWSIVIVGDLGGEKRARPPMLLTGRSASETSSVALRLNSGMETVNYAEWRKQEELRQRAEEKRLLYVAATRARDYLVLPWFAEKGHYLDVIKGVFDPAHEGETIAMFFRRDGKQSRTASARSSEVIRVELDEPEPSQRNEVEQMVAHRVEWLAAREGRLVRANAGRASATPSRLADEKKPETEKRTGASVERAAMFGTVMHEVLSMIDFTKANERAALWKSSADLAGMSADETKRGAEMLERFARTELFGRIARANEIHREMPFASRKGDAIIEGIMDLVFREGDEWTLLDYKTDHVSKEDVAGHAEGYRPQIDAYAEALKTIGGIGAAKIVMFLRPCEAVRL